MDLIVAIGVKNTLAVDRTAAIIVPIFLAAPLLLSELNLSKVFTPTKKSIVNTATQYKNITNPSLPIYGINELKMSETVCQTMPNGSAIVKDAANADGIKRSPILLTRARNQDQPRFLNIKPFFASQSI